MSLEIHHGAPGRNFYYSRENRQLSTNAEKALWAQVRNRKLQGFKFRRQHPIADFVADFYCHEGRLVVEIDGEYHNDREQHQYDEGRVYELKELNVKVIRFTNREVLDNMDFVLKKIQADLSQPHMGRPTPP